ncbi:hypothetical protein AB0F15_09860 [Amycolatopsis sp. NPDC026612]|uniref:hypothetical protein n=1 Tax=Amycolatopsis sp. NPDC026612 TaxID=3155466 RepID=UPI0033F68F72
MAGVITASTALITILAQTGVIGSNSTPTPSPAPVAANAVDDHWITGATSVCTQADSMLNSLQSEVDQRRPWPGVVGKIAAIYRAMDMDLRNVSAPVEARQRIQLMTGAWDQAAGEYEHAATDYAGGNAAQVLDDLQRAAEANARGNQVADDLNLSPCASAGAGLTFGVY